MIRLISFEGGDGSGKTTQLELLEQHLAARGVSCFTTREPGGTPLGKMIRQVLLEVGKQPISSPTELFLYLADRAHHVQEVISPAFRSGKLVLCDRFTDSTLAYQGYGREVDLNLLRQLNDVASRGIRPDLTLLFDCPVEVGLSRTARRGVNRRPGDALEDRFEREQVEFHERVREGFLKLARAEPERFYILEASRPISEVHAEVKRVVDDRLSKSL